jgi:hypothetical protein
MAAQPFRVVLVGGPGDGAEYTTPELEPHVYYWPETAAPAVRIGPPAAYGPKPRPLRYVLMRDRGLPARDHLSRI